MNSPIQVFLDYWYGVSGSRCLTRPILVPSTCSFLARGVGVGSQSKGEICDLYLQSRCPPDSHALNRRAIRDVVLRKKIKIESILRLVTLPPHSSPGWGPSTDAHPRRIANVENLARARVWVFLSFHVLRITGAIDDHRCYLGHT